MTAIFIITSNIKTLQLLDILSDDIWSSPAPALDSSQLTQGGSKVRRPCQSIIGVGAVQNTLNSLI